SGTCLLKCATPLRALWSPMLTWRPWPSGTAVNFRSVGASHGASRLRLSLMVRISHERGDFCGRVAVDFLRKTVYLRKASKPAHLVRTLPRHWLESHTVTANSLPPLVISLKKSR